MHPRKPPQGTPTFGAFLRHLRERSGWTQRATIKAANTNHRVAGLVVTALSHWEDDRRVPSPVQLSAILRVLDPDPSDLLSLLDLAAAADPRYAGLIQVWSSTKAHRKARIDAFTAWASTFPTRPPRRKSWREAAEAAERHRAARAALAGETTSTPPTPTPTQETGDVTPEGG